MKRRISIVMAVCMVAGMLSGCGDTADETGGSAGGDTAGTQTVSGTGSGVFTGELEQGVTIRVLENDTAISKGYFDELLTAFNEAYAEYGIVAVDANMDQYLDLANDGPYGYGPDRKSVV